MRDTILLPQPPSVVEEKGNQAVIEITGLHPGYGITLGNALRRVLLSSLAGAAVTSVKIKNINHEFSTLAGVLEDILTILLNIKQLRFRIFTEEPRTLTLSQNGEKVITAKDLKTPSDVEVVNPDHHIATLTEKSSTIEMELVVEKGVGYVPKETLMRDKVEVGLMTLDAIFTPVRKVSYEIENMRVGTATNYNKLRLSIETDGSLTPREAFIKALSIFQEQLRALEHFEEEMPNKQEELPISREEGALPSFSVKTEEEQETAGVPMDTMKIKVDDLKLSSRTINSLSRAGIKTVGNLVKKSAEELLEIEGFGERALNEIQRSLGNLGLTLRQG